MFEFIKRSSKRAKLDRKVLRKNDISLLTLDERWNSLFGNIEKTPVILKCEDKIRELLKLQARLIAEEKEIAQKKKKYMDKIMKLTTEAFDNNNETAKTEMGECEKEIKGIKDRVAELQNELEEVPDKIKDTNLELLEETINVVYFKIRANQKRVEELGKLIEETHLKLKEYIDEKGTLNEDYTDTYSYFHDLLGGEELEKLDKEFFK
jgi:chromosome segregation ATPase